MNEIYRNRLLAEYSRQELEEDFIRSCEELDEKATEIIKLEKQAKFLEGRLGRLEQDIEDQTKQQVCFDGKHAPMAFRQSQLQVKELLDQIAVFERELGQRQVKRDKVLNEVRYFRSLLNYPGKKAKNQSQKGTSKSVSRAELVHMLSVLLTGNQVPQTVHRLQAAIAILNRNLGDAEIPMRQLMSTIGETLQLFDMLDKKKQIKEREDKIEELRVKLAQLRQRHEEMTKQHQDLLQQYKDEADQNNQRYKEEMELQHEKEAKDAEAAKLAEMKIIRDGLKNENALLEDQIDKLKADNEARLDKLKKQSDDALEKLQEEQRDLENHCAALRASNKDMEMRCKQLENQYEDAKARRADIEDLSKQLQAEYTSLRQYFVKMLSATDDDPFENPRFREFLEQMADKDWRFDTIKTFTDDIEKLKTRKSMIEEKLAKYENVQGNLNNMIATKRSLITDLRAQLDALQLELGQSTEDLMKQRPAYVEGAEHIHVEMETLNLQDDQTAVQFSFQNFELDPSLISNQKCKIFLVVEFYDHKPSFSNYISPMDGTFDLPLAFITRNDYQLREYIQRSYVNVTLCVVRGMAFEEVAVGKFDLTPFLDEKEAFTSSMELKSKTTHQPVGKIQYEAQLVVPLLK